MKITILYYNSEVMYQVHAPMTAVVIVVYMFFFMHNHPINSYISTI